MRATQASPDAKRKRYANVFLVHPVLVLMKVVLSIYKLTALNSTELFLYSKACRINLYNEVTNRSATAINLSSVYEQQKPNKKLLNW